LWQNFKLLAKRRRTCRITAVNTGMRAVVLAVLSALVLAPPAADAFRGGGDCSDIPRLPSDRRGNGQGRSNRLTLATFDARWIATMSPVNATAKGEKQDKAVADRLRAEDRERYRAFGKLLAEIKADVVDVSGTNGCGALRQMLSAEVQLFPEHASKVRQYLHERPEDKGIAMRHTGMLTYVDPSANITRFDDARAAYPLPHTRCPADERDREDRSSCESEYSSCAAADAADADDDASSCAADAARSCDAAGTRVTGPPKDHYVTRMAVGNKNVTLLVVHFDEPDWSCARREAAATILANEATRTRRGGLGFRVADGTDPDDDDDDAGGEASGAASSSSSFDGRTRVDDLVVIARLPSAGAGFEDPAAPHPTDADVVADALALRGTELELYEPGGFQVDDVDVDDAGAESLDRPRRNRTSAVFLSKTLVEWTTKVTAREVPTPGSETRKLGHPLVVDITFKAYCAFSGDVDTWREFFTPAVACYALFEAACFCVWALGLYRLFLGKDEGPHWMKNFYRWQMDVPTLEEFLAEEERLNELEEREEAEAEAKRERRAKGEGEGEGEGETAVEDRDGDGSS